jgi:hypothetical protein
VAKGCFLFVEWSLSSLPWSFSLSFFSLAFRLWFLVLSLQTYKNRAPWPPSLGWWTRRSEYLNPSVSVMASTMDLDGMSTRRWLHSETFGVLGNYTLDLESGLAIELATQSILDSETLGEVGRLDEGVQGRLECHGDGDGGDWCEDKLGLDFGGDQTGGAFAQLSLQGAVQGLDWEHTLADTMQG